MREITQQSRNLKENVQETQKLIKDLNQLIYNESQRLATDMRAHREHHENEIKRRKGDIEEIKQKMASARLEMDQISTEADVKQKTRIQIADVHSKNERFLKEGREAINSLRQQQDNRLAAFGSKMPQLIAKVKEYTRMGRWIGKEPIGPIGMFIKIKEPVYSKIIEYLIGSSLSAMIVDNQQDLKALQQIGQQVGHNPLIFRASNKRLGQIEEPNEDLLTVLRAIDISNDVAREQLIIQNRPEQLVLVDNSADGDRLTERGFPRNVNAVYTKDLYQCGSKHGGYSSQALRPRPGPSQLVTDVTHAIR
ncbi:Structural maintenance of chromosomes protein 6 [Nowakowskiella sp. JEL0078]|nr:Structural maintenance of chromosomes protein 6 [Nowakowskiella sp. JEL0078]